MPVVKLIPQPDGTMLLSQADDGQVSQRDIQVVREGSQIILPPKMTYDEAIEWMKRKKTEEEKDVRVHNVLSCSPLDGAVNFHRALAKIYGWTESIPTPGFWGPNPPVMVGVPTGVDEMVQVPWGRIQVPAIHGFLETGMQMEPNPAFIIGGVVKQKHLNDVKKIVETTQRLLVEQSIYKQKAIKVSFEWQREEEEYNPSEHAPQFMKLEGVAEDDLILSESVRNALDIGLFWPIEYSEACRNSKVPLKRSVLLHGTYGTGKTLCANVSALKATKNKWTFIYLDDVQDLKKGLQFAMQYAPAVLFAEDIDRSASGKRTSRMDGLLNTLDGVDTKGKEIITVFTTNHIEDINPAILRMGRVDTCVEVTPPDADAAVKLVKKYGRGLIHPQVNYQAIGNVLAGRIPAFIREVTERAKIAAIARTEGGEIVGQVLESDMMSAATAMRSHAELLNRQQKNGRKADVYLRVRESVAIGANGNGDAHDEEEVESEE